MAMINISERSVLAFFSLQYKSAVKDQTWMRFTRRVDTNQPDGEKFAGSEPGTGMKEKGTEQPYRTRTHVGFTLPNRSFENARTLSEDEVNGNKVSKAEELIGELATFAAEAPGDMVEDLILSATAVDPIEPTLTFFNDGHTRQGTLAVQSNLYTGTAEANHTTYAAFDPVSVTAPTDNEWLTILFAGARILREMTNSAGQRINRNKKRFTVATNGVLWESLMRTLSKRTIGGGDTNPILSNRMGWGWTPMHLPSQTSDDYLYFFVEDGSPMILQYYKVPEKPVILGPGTEHWKKHEEMLMKVSGTYNCGFEHYIHALKVLLKT